MKIQTWYLEYAPATCPCFGLFCNIEIQAAHTMKMGFLAQVLEPVTKYMDYIALLKESGMTVLELKDSDMMTALQKTVKHGLITADAAHYAVMERKGMRHIATGDNDFKDIPELTLWMPIA